MIDLHKIFQAPINCPCKWLLAFVTARGTFVNSCPSPVMSLFCADRIESIEWQDLEQRQRNGDQVSKIFCPRWSFVSASSSRRPCHFGSPADFAFSVFWEVSIKYCASLILIPLSLDVPNLSPEKCVREHALLCPPENLRTPPTIQESLANGLSESRLSSLFLFWVWPSEGHPHHSPGASPSLRSWAGLVEDKSCNVDVDDELPLELVDNPGTTRGTKFPFCS